jgi:hypothetical protein
MIVDESKILRIIKEPKKSGGARTSYELKCTNPDFEEIIKVRKLESERYSGLCQSHSHMKRPFESIYHGIFNDWRKPEVLLNYEEFLEFTKIQNCHYCGDTIPWKPYATVKGEFGSRAYFLDKKDHQGPYSKENCVVCCSECNYIKGARFSYKEYVLLGEVIRGIRDQRKSA